MDTTLKAVIPTALKTVGIFMLTLIVIKMIQFACFVRKQWDMFKDFPFLGQYSFITGTLHNYSGANFETFKTMQHLTKTFRRFHIDWAGPILPFVILSHPDVVKTILKTSEPKPRKLGLGMSTIYEMIVPWLGEGLLVANGERWARNRRLLTSAFHFDILNPYVKVYNEAADVLLSKMEESYQTKQPFELFENVSLTSLDILLQCAFSYNSNCQILGEKHDYVVAVQELLDLWITRSISRRDVVARKVCDVCHDTTTSAICWILYSLAQHPDIQERVYQEIASVMGNREEEFLTWNDFQELEYLSLCIKEGLRLHTPVPFIQRKTTKLMTIDGFTIPVGTLVGVQLYELHHNPDVWKEPDEFRPERFLPENIKDKDPYAFSPFSAGPRNCIDQNFAMGEMKTVISRILYRYHLTLNPHHEVRPKVSAVMKAETGIQILVTPRT